ncbi:hypothetical protein A3C89_04005 [Candidatus Kaiserbacteria bacterium RIFCSPHIGHO2_02_FULL_50_50]|uniref:DUF3828 domain-containing protein n=1 Tax=Candidatus Kaiserbacteria bacterium RIFCSPHIGHO2_02_FULL_50_50 TaxID=1798492 RepID=A0A1F6DHP9_9BACT|nr:MAG: hypothetical protein A3C89_04005 [Candidatus Kaiserbacteria bacterium RIFCSPHIGHO2_02_FULL_50_50]
MKDNKKIGIILAIIVVTVLGAVFVATRNGGSAEKWNGVSGESIDVALGFYLEWVGLKDAADKTVAASELLARAPLAESLKATLAENVTAEVDPVACRAFDEAQTRTQIVFEREDAAQYIMQVTKGELTEGYAVVDLVGKEGQWQIQNIACAKGDVAPEAGEFSYTQAGTLLKQVPAPYDAKLWHLIFQDGNQVGITPLIFTDASKCIADGKEVACDENYLFETKEVTVFGQMTEIGAEVARVEVK